MNKTVTDFPDFENFFCSFQSNNLCNLSHENVILLVSLPGNFGESVYLFCTCMYSIMLD